MPCGPHPRPVCCGFVVRAAGLSAARVRHGALPATLENKGGKSQDYSSLQSYRVASELALPSSPMAAKKLVSLHRWVANGGARGGHPDLQGRLVGYLVFVVCHVGDGFLVQVCFVLAVSAFRTPLSSCMHPRRQTTRVLGPATSIMLRARNSWSASLVLILPLACSMGARAARRKR